MGKIIIEDLVKAFHQNFFMPHLGGLTKIMLKQEVKAKPDAQTTPPLSLINLFKQQDDEIHVISMYPTSPSLPPHDINVTTTLSSSTTMAHSTIIATT